MATSNTTHNGESPQRHPEPPIELEGLKLGKRVTVAAGVEAVEKTLEFVMEEPGLPRGVAALYRLNQFDGYDCPGCAWPDPDNERSSNEYCENGAKAIAEETTRKRVTPEFFANWSVPALSLQSDYWLGRQGRLTRPMLLREGGEHYEPVGWDEAFDLIAAELQGLASPNEAAFYTSGRTSNEAAFLYQLFAREYGTNNLPDCSNMCHESSGSALSGTIGIGKGTVTLADFELADVILIIGQNPGTNHPRMLTHLLHAARRGATIISVNPLSETGLTRFKHPQEMLHILGPGTRIAREFVQVRVNGDMAFFRGIARVMLEEEERHPGTVLAHEFLRSHTSGFEAYREAARLAQWPEIEQLSGIPEARIREIAAILMRSRATIACWAMGLTQHKNSVATIQEVVNVLLLGGHLGRAGAGVCPVRGHSNVQGDRTMGIWEKPPQPFLDKLKQNFGFEPPREHGFDVVECIKAMAEGRVKVFFAMGGNFLSATPDTEFTAKALSQLRLSVHVSTKLNRSHLITGRRALILPCLGRSERDAQPGGDQFVSVENSMGIVHSSLGRLEPASEHLLSEPMIVARLAAATLGGRSRVPWVHLTEDYDRIRELIARTIPGFDDYNTKVRYKGGFYLPNAARENQYKTATGKANFSANPLTGISLRPGQFVLMTLRSHDQYNTTIYGLDDRYRGVYHGRRVLLLNPEDARELRLNKGDLVDITSHYQGQRRVASRFVVLPYDLPRRCAAAYFPETNVLVPIDSTAEQSNTPTSKSVIVTLAPAAAVGHAVIQQPAIAGVS